MIRLLGIGLTVALLAGCMGPRIYSSTLPKNMNVITQVDGGSVRVEVAFDIHTLKPDCETDFEGRINLENGNSEVSLPTGKPLYLEFIFVSSEMFNSSIGAIRQGTILTALPGATYRAGVNYKKGIYDLEIRESRKGGASREIAQVPLSSCKVRR